MKSHLFFVIRLLVCGLGLSLAPAVRAQPGSGGPEPGAPTAVPLDGGVSLLLAAGLGLGLRRLRQRRPGQAVPDNARARGPRRPH
ncbi:PID-CTERM protein-sorting domain-containing protein [Hymenobacter antarcticus]|uniref:VPDSG-CTERM protein sorting domain-containing protein n=1 Tax=Hymenobacter antarcticus TaxID=486270 RepID=A0ABP7PSL4_9BACT